MLPKVAGDDAEDSHCGLIGAEPPMRASYPDAVCGPTQWVALLVSQRRRLNHQPGRLLLIVDTERRGNRNTQRIEPN